jgi:hypothetical protein
MAMTPEVMTSFFALQADGAASALESALETGNYYLATLNIGEEFKCRLMQGLITWRISSGSPVVAIKAAVSRVYDGIELTTRFNMGDVTKDLPMEKASIVGFLVDLPSPVFSTSNLVSERLLDAVLARGLRDSWDDVAWYNGIEQLQKRKGAALAVETYSTYRQLICDPSQDQSKHLIDLAGRLFQKRAKDPFFTGGDQTEGGGADNAVTVDYRLAAIMKRNGQRGGNMHDWRWSSP